MTLVGSSSLSSAHKAFLLALLEFANWEDGSGICASVTTMAARMSKSERAVERYLKALKKMGVIHFDRESRGGRLPGGRGRTHLIRIVFDMLPARRSGGAAPHDNPDNLDRPYPDTSDIEPRHSCAPTPTTAAKYPDTVSEELLRQQFEYKTINPTDAERHPHRELPVAPSDGGGGGDVQSWAERKEPSGQPTHARTTDSELVRVELLKFGICAKNAIELSQVVTLAQAKAAIALQGPPPSGQDHRPGRVVQLLRDPVAREQLKPARTIGPDAEARRQRIAIRARGARLIPLRLKKLVAEGHIPNGDVVLRHIFEAWPSEDHYAEDDAVSDKLLLDGTMPTHDIFDRLSDIVNRRTLVSGDVAKGISVRG